MSAILKVRLSDGSVYPIPSIKGEKGDAPIKGIDYWTVADKAEIVSAVLAALPAAEGVGF